MTIMKKKESRIRFILIFVMCSLLPCFITAQNNQQSEIEKLNNLSLEELMDIDVITATGIKQKMTEAPSTILVITAQQIKERGYEELEDVLRDLAGVDLIRVHGRAPTFITFRGMYGDENRRVLIMMDGVVENNIMGDFAIAGPAYTLFNVDRIEILWGPGSALYGANAFGAVINIITKKEQNSKGIHFQSGYGSFNTLVENLQAGINKSNFDFNISGSYFNTDGPRFSNNHPNYTNSYVKNAWSLNSTISYKVKKFKITLGARMYQTPQGWGAPLASPTQLLGLPSQGNLNSGAGGMLTMNLNGTAPSLTETISRTTFLQCEYTHSPKLSFFVRAQYRETELTPKTYVYLNSPGTNFFIKNIIAYYANRTGGEFSSNYSINENHQLSAGIQFYQDNLEKGFREMTLDNVTDTIDNIPLRNTDAGFKPRKYTIQNSVGTYVQYILNTSLLHKTNFTVGARFDYNSVYGKTFNPRIGITNHPTQNAIFKLLYGTAFRAPSNFELYSASPVRLSNETLKPEKIQTFEANIILTPFHFLSSQINLFHNELKDVIIQDIPIGIALTQNQNAGTAAINGIEVKMDFIPSKRFSSFLNFTFLDGKQNNGITKSVIPNVATYKGNIGCSIYITELLSINIIENWVGDRNVIPTNPIGKAAGYFATNLVISTNKPIAKCISASINIRNLFNQTFYDPGIRGADGNFYATLIEQPGINALFKIGISLN